MEAVPDREAIQLLKEKKRSLEFDCNETNNYRCRIVTEFKENDDVAGLTVYPRTDNTGEYEKTNGWDRVIEEMKKLAQERDDLYFGADPGELYVVYRGE